MEWGDFQLNSLLQDSNVKSDINLSSPQLFESRKVEWTFEENKLFENALTEVQPDSLGFFENIASRVPWKSMDEIKIHYQALVEDLEMIESGHIPPPDYQTQNLKEHRTQKLANVTRETLKNAMTKESPPPMDQPKKTSNGQQRRRGVPWTEEEHQLFLRGLNKYGKGDWRSVSRYYVITKTPTQVASHAQKYFRRQMSSTPPERRRPSIHDIHTVNPSTTSAPRHGLNMMMLQDQPIVPDPGSGGIFPLLNRNFIDDISCSTAAQNPATSVNQNQLPSAPALYLQTNQQQYWG